MRAAVEVGGVVEQNLVERAVEYWCLLGKAVERLAEREVRVQREDVRIRLGDLEVAFAPEAEVARVVRAAAPCREGARQALLQPYRGADAARRGQAGRGAPPERTLRLEGGR